MKIIFKLCTTHNGTYNGTHLCVHRDKEVTGQVCIEIEGVIGSMTKLFFSRRFQRPICTLVPLAQRDWRKRTTTTMWAAANTGRGPVPWVWCSCSTNKVPTSESQWYSYKFETMPQNNIGPFRFVRCRSIAPQEHLIKWHFSLSKTKQTKQIWQKSELSK